MDDRTDPPTFRMTTPGEVAQLVPYLVGFIPEESLVLLVVRDHKLAVTARIDMAEAQQPDVAEDLLDRVWARYPDANAYLIGYTGDQDAAWQLLERCERHLSPSVQTQIMVVDQGTWHGADGESGPIDQFGPLAAQATFHGLQTRTRREDLAADLASGPDSPELAKRAANASTTLPSPQNTEQVIARTQNLLARHLPAPDEPTTRQGTPVRRITFEDAVQLSLLVSRPIGCDVALLSITSEDPARHLKLWRDVINTVPDRYAEVPLYLAGMAAWINGDGATACVALERTEQLIGAPVWTRPAMVLQAVIDQVLPPTEWEALRAQFLEVSDRRVRTAITGTPATHSTTWERVTARHPSQNRPAQDTRHQPPGIAI